MEVFVGTVVANQHFAGRERCEQRNVVRQHAKFSVDAGSHDEVGLLAEHAALGGDELALRLGHFASLLASGAESGSSAAGPSSDTLVLPSAAGFSLASSLAIVLARS